MNVISSCQPFTMRINLESSHPDIFNWKGRGHVACSFVLDGYNQESFDHAVLSIWRNSLYEPTVMVTEAGLLGVDCLDFAEEVNAFRNNPEQLHSNICDYLGQARDAALINKEEIPSFKRQIIRENKAAGFKVSFTVEIDPPRRWTMSLGNSIFSFFFHGSIPHRTHRVQILEVSVSTLFHDEAYWKMIRKATKHVAPGTYLVMKLVDYEGQDYADHIISGLPILDYADGYYLADSRPDFPEVIVEALLREYACVTPGNQQDPLDKDMQMVYDEIDLLPEEE